MLETLTRRSMQLLRLLYEKGNATNTYSIHIKQNDLAQQLAISRQALSIHLKKLRDLSFIRTGRGFIDVTEKGLNMLGVFSNPAFVLIKVSPHRRDGVYEEIKKLDIQRAFRIAGDIDALIVIQRMKLDDILRRLSYIKGIRDTRSYVAIKSIK